MNDTKPKLTFIGSEVTRAALMESVQRHADLDQIVAETYGKVDTDGVWRGCAVGCSLHDFGYKTSDHGAFWPAFHVPPQIAGLQDGIFETLPESDRKGWVLRFWNAIPEGKDLSLVWPKFARYLLADPQRGLIIGVKNESVIRFINSVDACYAAAIDGGDVDAAEKSARAAWDALDAWDARAALDADKLVQLLQDAPVLGDAA